MGARAVIALASAACALPGCRAVFGFTDPVVGAGDDAIDAADTTSPDTPAGVFDVAHLDDSKLHQSTSAVTWSGNVTIDTSALTISTPLNGDAAFYTLAQDSGPSVAVLEVGALHVMDKITVKGTVALVIVAHGAIVLDDEIDVSASAANAGPGASTKGTGQPGGHVGTFTEGGGGGGGFATPGGDGGSATTDPQTASGGTGGAAYGDLRITLEGGSPGSVGSPSCVGGGGGGGAIQLSTPSTLTLGKQIHAGGGGGRGGVLCANPANMASGGGGGSGGAIYLQAAAIVATSNTRLAANGGGGGAGGNFTSPMSDGTPGNNGAPNTSAAAGGPSNSTDGGAGGSGGALVPPTAGQGLSGQYPNGGGGGGAPGRIYLDIPATAIISLTSSPMYQRSP